MTMMGQGDGTSQEGGTATDKAPEKPSKKKVRVFELLVTIYSIVTRRWSSDYFLDVA